MKVNVTFKDPDSLYDAIREAVEEEVRGLQGISDEEKGSLIDGRVDEVKGKCRKWFEYGEYLRVQVDTDAETCIVLPV